MSFLKDDLDGQVSSRVQGWLLSFLKTCTVRKVGGSQPARSWEASTLG